MAAALDEAPLQLVLQRRWLQAAWPEVRSPDANAIYRRGQKKILYDRKMKGVG